jgi:hypothetical protein
MRLSEKSISERRIYFSGEYIFFYNIILKEIMSISNYRIKK